MIVERTGLFGPGAPFAKNLAPWTVFPLTTQVWASHKTPAMASNSNNANCQTPYLEIAQLLTYHHGKNKPELAPKLTFLIIQALFLHTAHCLPVTSDTAAPLAYSVLTLFQVMCWHIFAHKKKQAIKQNHHTLAAVRHRNTSTEQKQRNTNNETKTHILVHQKRHLTMEGSANPCYTWYGVSQDGTRMATFS